MIIRNAISTASNSAVFADPFSSMMPVSTVQGQG